MSEESGAGHRSARPGRARDTETRLPSGAGQAELLIGKRLRSLLSVFTGSGHSSPADPRLRVTGTRSRRRVEHILRPLWKRWPSQTTPGHLESGRTPLRRWSPPCPPARFPFLPPRRRPSTPGAFYLSQCPSVSLDASPPPPGSRAGIGNNSRAQSCRCPHDSPSVTRLKYGHSGQFSF